MTDIEEMLEAAAARDAKWRAMRLDRKRRAEAFNERVDRAQRAWRALACVAAFVAALALAAVVGGR